MESPIERIKGLLSEKSGLFREIRGLLEAERACIETIDVDALWSFSGKKEAAAQRIGVIRSEILGLLESLGIDHGMDLAGFSLAKVIGFLPREHARELSGMRADAALLKAEITTMARENRASVQEYLGVLDGMITTMAGAARGGDTYGPSAARGGATYGPSAARGGAAYGSSAGAGYGPSAGGVRGYGPDAFTGDNRGREPGAGAYAGHGGGSTMLNARA